MLLFETLARVKGVELLVEAFPRVLATHPRAQLVLAGFPGHDFPLEDVERRIFSGIRNPLDEAVSYYFRYRTNHQGRYSDPAN